MKMCTAAGEAEEELAGLCTVSRCKTLGSRPS
jgi:hypothetical protein